MILTTVRWFRVPVRQTMTMTDLEMYATRMMIMMASMTPKTTASLCQTLISWILIRMASAIYVMRMTTMMAYLMWKTTAH